MAELTLEGPYTIVFSEVISDIARLLEDPSTVWVETLEVLFGPKILGMDKFYDSMSIIGHISKMFL